MLKQGKKSCIDEVLQGISPIDPDSPISRHTQLREKILTLLHDRRFSAGERFPSIRKVTSHFNVGKISAQQVFDELADKGIIRKVHGKGCFVNRAVKRVNRKLSYKISVIINKPVLGEDFNSATAKMLSGVSIGLSEFSWSASVENARNDGSEFLDICTKYRNGETDGLILFGNIPDMDRYMAKASQFHMPIIIINNERADCLCVIAEVEKACLMLSRQFINEGKESIAVISTGAVNSRFRGIEKGIRKAFKEKDKEFNGKNIAYFNDWDFGKVKSVTGDMLVSHDCPQIIFSSPEMRTMAVFEATREMGKKVSVVSIDDFAELQLWTEGRLHHIKVPYFEMGIKAGQIMAESLKSGKELTPGFIRIKCPEIPAQTKS